MATAPDTVTLRVEMDEAAYQEVMGKLRALVALTKQAHPRGWLRELWYSSALFWIGALAAHLFWPA